MALPVSEPAMSLTTPEPDHAAADLSAAGAEVGPPSRAETPKVSQAAVTPVRRIYIVEEHPVVIRGLMKLFSEEPRWQICGTTSNYGTALEEIEGTQPDLVIADLNLKGRSGLDLVRKLRRLRPRPRTLIFSTSDECLYAFRALRAGASGYVMKIESRETVLMAVRQILEGRTYLSPGLIAQRAAAEKLSPFSTIAERLQHLTNRELDVLRLIGQGQTTREVAQLLGLSIKTIGSHRANIMAKLGLTTASQLVQHAIEFGAQEPCSDILPPAPARGPRKKPNANLIQVLPDNEDYFVEETTG